MGYRGKPIDSDTAAFNDVYTQLREIKDSLRDRLLPPGYVIDETPTALVITRASDGATTTLSFT